MTDKRTMQRIERLKFKKAESLDGEIWCDIDGFIGIYQVSNLGRIKRIACVTKTKNGKQYFNAERLMNLVPDRKGYIRVQLRLNSSSKYYSVHRFVAKHFIPNPNNLPEVNHLLGIKADNRASQLEWCTRSHNKMHSYQILGEIKRNGIRNGNSKLSADKIKLIKGEYSKGLSFKELGEKFGISHTHAWRILKGKTWAHL